MLLAGAFGRLVVRFDQIAPPSVEPYTLATFSPFPLKPCTVA